MNRIEAVDIQALVQEYGTPLYVYSAEKIRSNFTSVLQAFSRRYSKYSVHYAVKANTNEAILKMLLGMGAGADVASPGECAAALRAGFKPEHILYTGNYESDADLEYALKQKVQLNLDSRSALEAVLRIGKPECLSFRVNPGVGKGAFAQIITGGEESKFGTPFEELGALYERAQSAGVKRFGLHMHVGSSILDPSDFHEIVLKQLEIAGPLFSRLGIQPEFIDIGGGLGIPYRDEEKELDIEQTAEKVVAAFKEGCARHRLGEPRLVMEPGRYFVGNAGWLIARVTRVKKSYRKFVGLDAGMQTLIRPALYGAFHRVKVVGAAAGAPEESVDLCGQICESTDVFVKDLKLPVLKESDLVAFSEAGAYGYSMSMSYNGRPRPAEVLVEGQKSRLIRARETIDDLFRFQR